MNCLQLVSFLDSKDCYISYEIQLHKISQTWCLNELYQFLIYNSICAVKYTLTLHSIF